MSDDLLREAHARFEAFTAPYLNEPGDDFAYKLKVEHTRQVLAMAEEITRCERLSEQACRAGRLAALLHDVGRFPQFRQYRTFRDADSANHAALSVKHILRERMLEGAPSDLRRLVLGAVYLHNKRTLPHRIAGDLRDASRIVRDSDKLDIFRVMVEYFSQNWQKNQEVVLYVKDESESYSPHVLETIRRREPGDYRDLVYVNDFKILIIGWLYDLNFATSCRVLAERGNFEALFASLPRDAAIDSFRSQIDADLAERLKHA